MEYIQLKKRESLKRFGIRAEDGTDTGEYIEIDVEDLDLPLKANDCQAKHIENYNNLNKKIEEAKNLSNEKTDNDVLSKKERAILEAFKEFYEAEEKSIDELLGEGATRKLLGGRRPYLTMHDDINEYLEQIIPVLKNTQENVISRIKNKYGKEKEDNILWVIQNMPR